MGNIRQEETIPKLISHGDKPTKVQMGHGLIAISIKKGNKSSCPSWSRIKEVIQKQPIAYQVKSFSLYIYRLYLSLP